MQTVFKFLQNVGMISLDLIWFPLGIWTIIATAAFLILKSLKNLNPLYHYHLRLATIFAVPFGMISSLITQKIGSNGLSTSGFDATLFVIQNPIQISSQFAVSEVEFTPNWLEPNFLIGAISLVLAIVSLIMLIRLGISFITLKNLYHTLDKSQISNRFNRDDDSLKDVQIAFHEHPLVPFTFGFRNPVIVLPKTIQNNHTKTNMAIQHELVHIKRGDYLFQLLFSIIQSLLWFHPVIHLAKNEIETWREISCDLEVLNTTEISAKKYASMLYELVPLNRGLASFSISMAVQESTLKKRIEKMNHHNLYKTSIKKSLVFLGLLIVGITLPIACSDLKAPEGLSDQEIENIQMSLTNTSITINGVDVTEGNNSGGVMASGHYALFIIVPKYGVFKFAPSNFEGGKPSGSFKGNTAKFTINNLTVEIEAQDAILSINDEVELWADHSTINTEDFGTGAARLDYSIQRFMDESAIYDQTLDSGLSDIDSDTYQVVDQMPKLVGGLVSVQSKVVYPELAKRAGIEGRVVVQFIVTETGEVENLKIVQGIGGGCDEAAIEAIKNANFEPGIQRGEPVRVQFSMPIIFKLQDSDFTGSNNIRAIKPEDDWTMGEFFASIDSLRTIKD